MAKNNCSTTKSLNELNGKKINDNAKDLPFLDDTVQSTMDSLRTDPDPNSSQIISSTTTKTATVSAKDNLFLLEFGSKPFECEEQDWIPAKSLSEKRLTKRDNTNYVQEKDEKKYLSNSFDRCKKDQIKIEKQTSANSTISTEPRPELADVEQNLQETPKSKCENSRTEPNDYFSSISSSNDRSEKQKEALNFSTLAPLPLSLPLSAEKSTPWPKSIESPMVAKKVNQKKKLANKKVPFTAIPLVRSNKTRTGGKSRSRKTKSGSAKKKSSSTKPIADLATAKTFDTTKTAVPKHPKAEPANKTHKTVHKSKFSGIPANENMIDEMKSSGWTNKIKTKPPIEIELNVQTKSKQKSKRKSKLKSKKVERKKSAKMVQIKSAKNYPFLSAQDESANRMKSDRGNFRVTNPMIRVSRFSQPASFGPDSSSRHHLQHYYQTQPLIIYWNEATRGGAEPRLLAATYSSNNLEAIIMTCRVAGCSRHVPIGTVNFTAPQCKLFFLIDHHQQEPKQQQQQQQQQKFTLSSAAHCDKNVATRASDPFAFEKFSQSTGFET